MATSSFSHYQDLMTPEMRSKLNRDFHGATDSPHDFVWTSMDEAYKDVERARIRYTLRWSSTQGEWLYGDSPMR